MPARAWKARKTLTEALRRSGAPIPLTRGFQVARNRVSSLQSLFARHRQLFGWLVVVDRRCYSDGGLGFSPDGFRLRSRRCRNRGGLVDLRRVPAFVGTQTIPMVSSCRKRALMFYRIDGYMSRLSAAGGALHGD